MIKKISDLLSIKIYKHMGDNKYDIEVLSYGLECILNTLITTSVLLIFGAVTHNIILYVIWLIYFSLLRRYFGGFHAQTHFLCILTSIITCTISISICTHYNLSYIHNIIIIIFTIPFIIKYAPIPSKQNIALNSKKKKSHKICAILYCLLGTLISIIFKFYKLSQLSSLLVITIITVYLFAIIELILRKIQYEKTHNTEALK